MSIRSRLLWLLLPPLIVFITLISVFFYYNWYTDIKTSFRSHLKSIVISTAETIPGGDIKSLVDKLQKDKNPREFEQSALYQKYQRILNSAKEKLPISSLYIIIVEPVKKGETVLLNEPPSEINKVYNGADKDYAYRQIYLIDANTPSHTTTRYHHPGDNDFSESDEHTIYYTKKAFVTPTYFAHGTNERYMTGYAPILDSKGDVVALLAADFSLEVMDKKLQNAIMLILLSSAITIGLVVICVFFVADYISKPVRKLNNAALSIAGGNYEENIQVQGPQEIVELANTLNTMSECMQENINRLRESAIVRERMYGEYECSLLLQHQMLQNVIHGYQNPRLKIRLISSTYTISPKGLFVQISDAFNRQGVKIKLFEAAEKGFNGMYNLLGNYLTSPESFPSLAAQIKDDYSHLEWQARGMPKPCVWSCAQEKVLHVDLPNVPLRNRDLIIMFTSSFGALFENEQKIHDWFSKVLRHFAAEGFDLCMTMLDKELQYFTKRIPEEHDLHIICLQVFEGQ